MIIAGREKRVQTKLRPISDFFMIMFLFHSAPLVLSLYLSLGMVIVMIVVIACCAATTTDVAAAAV